MTDDLFDTWTKVKLYAHEGRPNVLSFPTQALRGTLPRLVLVSSPDTGRRVIAGTDWWGSNAMHPSADAVRANPATLRGLERPKGPPSRRPYMHVEVRKARWSDIVIYKRGFVFSVLITLLTAVAAIAAAVLGFATGTAPLGWGALVLLLACCAEVAKALRDLQKATHAP